jgi:RNA-directed DNA polymerase
LTVKASRRLAKGSKSALPDWLVGLPPHRIVELGIAAVPENRHLVEIPKPDGGVRKLGVASSSTADPAGLAAGSSEALGPDVFQAQLRLPTGTLRSSGSSPGAAIHCRGYNVVVDVDLEKFFDRVNHDSLMARVAARVTDKRVLKLIRVFLKSGVMEDGLVSPVDEGTPQSGPLSLLLSNLVLDDLDNELTRRGHRFCRYADDCNIYVRSRRAGERVIASVSRFLTNKLRLKVNEAKSAVARPEERKFLGFSITADRDNASPG